MPVHRMILALLAAGLLAAPGASQNAAAAVDPRNRPTEASALPLGTAPPTATAPMRLELPVRPLVVQMSGGGSPAWLTAMITAIGSLLASLIALTAALASVRKSNAQSAENTRQAVEMAAQNAQAEINQKANELEIESIEERLSGFFGPFMQLSEENKRLALLLRWRQSDKDFRTLKALLDRAWMKSAPLTDLNLVKQIVENGVQLRGLIRDKAGPVSPVLMPYFSRASAHFTILQLAHDGQLTHKTEDFAAYVYPRELDKVLELERDRLVARRNTLRSDLSQRHPPAEDLVIPSEYALDESKPAPAAERAKPKR